MTEAECIASLTKLGAVEASFCRVPYPDQNSMRIVFTYNGLPALNAVVVPAGCADAEGVRLLHVWAIDKIERLKRSKDA